MSINSDNPFSHLAIKPRREPSQITEKAKAQGAVRRRIEEVQARLEWEALWGKSDAVSSLPDWS